MRVFGPVVGAQTLLVPPGEPDHLQRRAVGSEFVSDNDGRREALPLQQLSEQLHRGGLVAPRLDHDVEHFAFAVDRPPHVHAPACDRDDHLIEVPLTVWRRSPAPEVGRDSRSKLQHPSTDGLVTDLQPDRKSTRLNSSHVAISYAVFCLKKKKTSKYEMVQTKKNNENKWIEK